MNVKYAFICGEEANYPIEKMCRWAKVPRSGFYEWRSRGPTSTALRRGRLEELVAFSFETPDGTYLRVPAYRRIHADLARRGVFADDETIRQGDA